MGRGDISGDRPRAAGARGPACGGGQRAIVFDFDGTLVDSMGRFADIAAGVIPKRLPVDSATARRLYLETSGLPFFQQLESLFPGNPANGPTAEEFEAAKLGGYLKEPLFDGAEGTIAYLKGRGIKVAVSSNNFQHLVERYVEGRGLDLDAVMGFKEGFAKGADHFAHVERQLGVARGGITYVGDSLKDGERAMEYGVAFIGKEGTFARGEFEARFPGARVIASLSELRAMF